MPENVSRLFDIDWKAFKPWRTMPIRHRMVDHPLLQLDSLTELSGRLDAVGRVRSHTNDAYAGTAFNLAPLLYPPAQSTSQTLANIASAKTWLSLLNVQADPIYRSLVDEVFDELKPMIDPVDAGMRYRAGWIFVTSPHTVTPFHIDREHNFILQIKGHKRLLCWEPDDIEVVSEAARDLFLSNHSRALALWREEFRSRAHVLELEPGMGVYMPSTSPHLIETCDEPSITSTFTFYTDSTIRHARLHTLHQRMRGWGMNPSAVGAHPLLDTVADVAAMGADRVKGVIGRLRGQTILSDRVPYAHANIA